MNAKHTPGPWSTDGRVLRNAACNSIASSGNNRVVTGDELYASMTLAASAPDLLAALEFVAEEFNGKETWLADKVRAAITRARGAQ